MSEELFSEFKVFKEDLRHFDTGGGFREVVAEIHIDTSLPIERQRVCLFHEILGTYLGSVVCRETLEEIAETLNEGLRELE